MDRNIAEVVLWGRTIGAVSLTEDNDVAAFEYAPEFVGSGIEVSPITMPLSRQIYRFMGLSRETFHGLPGLLADSLPDKYGNALIDAWLATQGRTADSFNVIERLCYTGARGMGALEFKPSQGPATQSNTQRIHIDQLVELASDILSRREDLSVSFEDADRAQSLAQILQVGTSAGGARAKAVIAWNRESNEVRSGQVETGKGFEHWIIKFDGVSGNRDKELADPKGYGNIEYAYSLMAGDCGINMNECRLFEENGRQHFMTRRFDRSSNGEKLHMQSLCALAHFDYNLAGAYSYEQVLMIMRQLELPMSSIEQMFRRMVFNIVARNQDDHVKNIAFLMNKRGEWSLAHAYDLTYNYNPAGLWTSQHQMSLNGKRDAFTLQDFERCSSTLSLKRGLARQVLEEVQQVVNNWSDYAGIAGVSDEHQAGVNQHLRLDIV